MDETRHPWMKQDTHKAYKKAVFFSQIVYNYSQAVVFA